MSENSQGAGGGAEGGDGLVENLFGEMVPAHIETRGRPKLAVTNELRDRVAVLAACKRMTRADIAAAIGCSEPTLREYFFRELDGGGKAKLAAAIERLYALGMDGNVTALSKFIMLSLKGEDVGAGLRRAVAPKLGKKEQADRDAHQPVSGWGDLVSPQQRVN